ncbi:MAG: DUF4382 domain-containing protein, partial [Planctomycetes bacterium]|nr:DUF4382 domain-containing protein [Planctomycetota bacterium]
MFPRFVFSFVFLLALAALSACGGGGTSVANLPGGGSTQTTGSVTLSIKDAPLSALQTFTIDVSKATLKGSGVTADAQIFPAPNSNATSVTVDLLSVQGFNQLLSAQ